MDNVNIIWGGKKAIVDLRLWLMEETRFASDLNFVSLNQQRDHGLLLVSLAFHNSNAFFHVLKCSSALHWKRMLDCLERRFLQVLVPVVLSYFPEVLIYIYPTQRQQKENTFHLNKRLGRNKTVWNKSQESKLQNSLHFWSNSSGMLKYLHFPSE